MNLKIKMVLLAILTVVFLIVFFLLFGFFFNWNDYQKKEIIINGQKIEAEIVKGALAKSRGLSNRPDLADDKGMLFIFKTPAIQRFWMKEMNFPIDIVWLYNGQVISFEENVQPQPGAAKNELKLYASPAPVNQVLEMKAGSVQRLGISPGNVIIFNI